MNVETGEIKEFASKISLGPQWELLDKPPDKNCRYCYGRGHNGFNQTLGKFVSCRCTKSSKLRRRYGEVRK